MQGGLGVRIGRDAGIIGVRFCFDKSFVFLVQGLGFNKGGFCDNISCMFHRSFCFANQEGLDIEDEDEKTLDENGLRGIRTVVLFEFCSRASSMSSVVPTSAFYIKLIALKKVVSCCRSLLNVFWMSST